VTQPEDAPSDGGLPDDREPLTPTDVPVPAAHDADPGLWDDQRRALSVALARQAPTLAGLYGYAVDALSQRELALHHVMVAAHCVREICNRLPDVLPAVDGVFPRSDAAVRELQRAWDDAGEGWFVPTSGALTPTMGAAPEPQQLATVPIAILDKAHAVVAEARRAERNAHARRSALVLGQVVDDDRRVRGFKKSLDFFIDFSHADRAVARGLPDLAEAVQHLERIEAVLRVRVADFFETAQRIGEALEAANLRDGSTYRQPALEDVRGAWALLNDPQHRRMFFEQLANPYWLPPLMELGAFDAIPEPVTWEDGTTRWDVWFEGEYLVRMASDRPADVSRALRKVQHTANPNARRQIVQSIAGMPAELAAGHVTVIGQYLDDPTRRWIDAQDIRSIIINLVEGVRPSPAKKLARAAYRPRPTPSDGSFSRGADSVIAALEPFWFQETFPDVAAALNALGEGWLRTLVNWVERYQTLAGHFNPDAGTDFGYQWRPSIEQHEQNHEYPHIGNALVTALLECASEQMRVAGGPGRALAILAASPQALVRRVGLAALARALPVGHPESLALAEGQLLDPTLLGVEARHEYAVLARAALTRLPAERQHLWVDLIRSGPPQSDVEIEAIVRWRADDDGDLPSLVARFKRVWQMRILSAIGMESLPAPAQALLRDLEGEFGSWDGEDMPGVITAGWVVHEPDPAVTGFASMSPADVAAFLRAWDEPESRGSFGGPSHQGNAEALRTIVASDPSTFAVDAESFRGLSPWYIDALLGGLRDGLDRLEDGSWDGILALAKWIAQQPEGFGDSGVRASRPSWHGIQRTLVSVIDAGVRNGQILALSQPLRTGVLDVLALLVTSTDPESETYGANQMDPLTASMNSVRPSSLRCLAELVKCYSSDDATEVLAGDIARALSLIDSRWGPLLDPSLAVAAALGQSLVHLAWHQPAWTSERLDRLLTVDQAYRDVVMTTALSTYTPSRFLLDLLRPTLSNWIPVVTDARQQVTAGWDRNRAPAAQLGDHLLMVAARGEIPADDDLLVTFFDLASVETRRDVIGRLGWILMHAEEVGEPVLARAMSLYDWRARSAVELGAGEELQQFYWWVRSGKFPPSWWLPRLIAAAECTPFDSHGMIGEALAAASGSHPGDALTALRLLLERSDRDRQGFGRYDLIQHAPQVLAAALNSGPDLAVDAKDLMDRLGRQGQVNLNELVARRREQ
jgi:hypothetical protein